MIRITLATFPPAQCAKITGVSVLQMNDWRRHHYIPRCNGHARLDIGELAEIAVMKALTDRGIGPKLAQPVGRTAGSMVAWHACQWSDSYSGLEHVPGEHSREKIARVNPIRLEHDPQRFMVWLADGTVQFVPSLDAVFDQGTWELSMYGPAIVLDLQALGGELGRRAEAPFVHIKVAETEDA
jgi:hypothetical protein